MNETNDDEKRRKRKEIADRRESFIIAYVGAARFNGTRAAEMAGYEVPRQEAARLLSNAVIRARIDAILDQENASARAVLHELTDIAFAEWRDFTETRYTSRGEPYEVSDLSSKVKALELLGKAHKLFVERKEVSGSLKVDATVFDEIIRQADANDDDE